MECGSFAVHLYCNCHRTQAVQAIFRWSSCKIAVVPRGKCDEHPRKFTYVVETGCIVVWMMSDSWLVDASLQTYTEDQRFYCDVDNRSPPQLHTIVSAVTPRSWILLSTRTTESSRTESTRNLNVLYLCGPLTNGGCPVQWDPQSTYLRYCLPVFSGNKFYLKYVITSCCVLLTHLYFSSAWILIKVVFTMNK